MAVKNRLRARSLLISFRGAFDPAFVLQTGLSFSNGGAMFRGLVAQLVEQCPFKALVQGSSPCQPTTFCKESLQNSFLGLHRCHQCHQL